MSKLDKLKAEVGKNADESTAGPDPGSRRLMAHQGTSARPPKMIGVERARDAAQIELARIVPDPRQPRQEFPEPEMLEMVESLRTHGQLTPISVRWDEDLARYVLLVGERRFQGAVRAGLEKIAAVIHEGSLTAAEILELQLVENLIRDDLKPIETARAIRRLMDEHGYTQQRVGERLKMSQASVAKSLSLLKLDPSVQEMVKAGKINKRAAEQIARVDTPEAQREVAEEVEAGHLTESEAAAVVKRQRPPRVKGRGGKKAPAKKKTNRVHNHNGLKIEARRSRGFELPELREALAGFLALVDAELAATTSNIPAE